MRVLVSSSLIFALSVSAALPTNAAEKPKANQACSKKNQIKAAKLGSFKCTQVGKKLIWKLQRSIYSQASGPSPQPTPSSNPSASPMPSPTPVPTETKKPITPPTKKPKSIADLDPETAWYFAWESMNKVRQSNQPYKAQYDIRISQNFKPEVRDVILEGLDAGSSFWSNFWKPNQPITVHLGTEKDIAFWQRELADFYDPRWNKNRDDNFNYLQETFRRTGAYNNSAGASWFTNRPNINFPYGSALQASDIRQNNWQTSPHEYTHIVQGVLGYAFNLNGIGPSWMSEGQAEHVGLFLTKSDPEQYLAYRNFRFQLQWNSAEQVGLKTPNQIHAAIQDRAKTPVYNAYYSYGTAAMEALVALHGHDAIIDYFKRIQTGTWWPDAFQQTFGTSHEQYLKEVSSYLAKLRSQITGVPIPVEVISEDYSKYIDTKKKAYDSINSKAVTADNSKFNFKYMVGENYPKEFEALNRKQVAYSGSVFSYFLDKKIDTTIYLYTEKEDKYLRSLPLWKDNQYWPENQVWFDRWKQGIATEHNIGLAAWYLVDPVNYGGHAGIAAPSFGSLKTQRYYNIQVLPHEFFHVIQDYYFRTRNISFSNSQGYDQAFPPLLREGSANTFSIAVTFDKFEDYRNFYARYASEVIQRTEFLRNADTEAKVVEALKRSLSKGDQQGFEAAYFTGALLFEWVIAEYGVEKYRQLLTDPAYGGNFDDLIRKVMGYDSTELFKRAAGHILSALKGD